jgi:hypothetical protein
VQEAADAACPSYTVNVRLMAANMDETVTKQAVKMAEEIIRDKCDDVMQHREFGYSCLDVLLMLRTSI